MRNSIVALLAIGAYALGCSSADTSPVAVPKRSWSIKLARPTPAEDPVVARVNGEPIFASCVTTQANAHALSPQKAVQECIDFELLAQEAEKANTASDPEVQTRAKRELVRSFITARYPLHSASDIPQDLVRRLWEKSKVPRYIHPELRNIIFCRIELDRSIGPDDERYQRAQTFLNGIYEKLRSRSDLKKADLFTPCNDDHKAAGIDKLELLTFHLYPASRYQAEFRNVVFSSLHAGELVAPLHTIYGWDLILITEVKPAINGTLAEHEDELRNVLFENPVFEGERDKLFAKWYDPIAKTHTIQVHPEFLVDTSRPVGAMP